MRKNTTRAGARFVPRLLLGAALGLSLLGARPALAQDPAPGSSLFVGRRVVVTNRQAGIDGGQDYLISTGEVKSVNADGSVDVAIYPYSKTAWGWDSNPQTKLKGVLLEGQPIKTVHLQATDLAKLNDPRFTAWVWEKDPTSGREQPWPKARVISDSGNEVKVFVYDKTGTSGSERVLQGSDLARFRELNVTTKPSESEATTAISPATEKAIADANAKLAANGNRLPSGEVFPPIMSLPELVSKIREIASSYGQKIEGEASAFVRADLQNRMLRDVFVLMETVNPIKHPRAASDAWSAAGREASSALSAAGETNWLQREIVERVNACYGKARVLWSLLNLAEVPRLTGMGFRLIDTEIHGLLYGKADDGSLMLWEPSEGYDPADWKIGARIESIFRDGDAGKGGQFLSYMPAFKPMNDGVTAQPRDNAAALAQDGLPPPSKTSATGETASTGLPADLQAAIAARDAVTKHAPSLGLSEVLDQRVRDGKDATDGKDGAAK